jgi:GntR family transcriptional regulator
MSIDRESHISMYSQIASLLESAIKAGELAPDQKIPTEAELMETYSVSRMTARLAIQSLHEKGLVVRKQGKGTFVIGSLIRQELGGMEGFYDSFLAKDLEAKLIEMKVMDTPQEVSEILGEAFNKSLFLKRIYLRKDEVYGFSHVYLPVELAKTVTWEVAENHSGYSLLTKHTGYELKNANLAIRAFPSTQEQADVLEVQAGDPILRLSRTTFTPDDKPIEHLKLFLRSDTCEFNITVPGHFSIVNGIRDATNEKNS